MGAEHIWEGKIARCADCIYGDFDETGDFGFCRRDAPSPADGFPQVHKILWCGDFVPVDQNQQSGY